MSIEQIIGIDVCKAHLDIHVPGRKAVRIRNEEAAIRTWAEGQPPKIVALEATGGYDRLVRRVLGGLGFDVRVLNPRKVRRLADVIGVSAKTDKLDAKTLSAAGTLVPASPPLSEEQQALRDRIRHAARLSTQIGELKRHLKRPELDPLVLASFERELAFMKAELKAFEEQTKALFTPEQKANLRLVMSVPGIGQVSGLTILAELPADLSAFNSGQLSSFSGLAPMDNTSGPKHLPRRIKPGNRYLKRALYPAALTTLVHYEDCKDFYTKLRSKGRAHQQAIIAVMHKLLRRAVAVLRRQSPWLAENPMGT